MKLTPVRLCNFLAKEYWRKSCSYKMLIKLAALKKQWQQATFQFSFDGGKKKSNISQKSVTHNLNGSYHPNLLTFQFSFYYFLFFHKKKNTKRVFNILGLHFMLIILIFLLLCFWNLRIDIEFLLKIISWSAVPNRGIAAH